MEYLGMRPILWSRRLGTIGGQFRGSFWSLSLFARRSAGGVCGCKVRTPFSRDLHRQKLRWRTPLRAISCDRSQVRVTNAGTAEAELAENGTFTRHRSAGLKVALKGRTLAAR